jgi:hypothetical protein
MFFHASKTPGLTTLKPHVSNHGKPLIYLSEKRENVLVYLSNAVEKHCKQTGFQHNGIYRKWGSYGFTKDGILRLEEYYPNATFDTYKDESGYIYSVEHIENHSCQADIPYAVVSEQDVPATACEYVPCAYEAIRQAAENGEIVLQMYADNSQDMLKWIEKTIREEYQNAERNPEYRDFLKVKFDFL